METNKKLTEQINKKYIEDINRRCEKFKNAHGQGVLSESDQAEWDHLIVELEEETKRLFELFNQLRNKKDNH